MAIRGAARERRQPGDGTAASRGDFLERHAADRALHHDPTGRRTGQIAAVAGRFEARDVVAFGPASPGHMGSFVIFCVSSPGFPGATGLREMWVEGEGSFMVCSLSQSEFRVKANRVAGSAVVPAFTEAQTWRASTLAGDLSPLRS